MKIVLKLGGSVFTREQIDIKFVKNFASKLKHWKNRNDITVVVGAGKLSRKLDKFARQLTSNENLLDQVGIYVARLNASLLIAALDELACPEIPREENEFLGLIERYPGKIIVAGGFRPGQRTDAVAVEIANAWNANLIIKCTDVDYVYDRDPDECPDAKPIKEMSFEKLKELAEKQHIANKPTIMDKTAAELLLKNKIKTIILNGNDMENMEYALYGKKFKGTTIK